MKGCREYSVLDIATNAITVRWLNSVEQSCGDRRASEEKSFVAYDSDVKQTHIVRVTAGRNNVTLV